MLPVGLTEAQEILDIYNIKSYVAFVFLITWECAHAGLEVISNDDSLFPFCLAEVTRLPNTHTSKSVRTKNISAYFLDHGQQMSKSSHWRSWKHQTSDISKTKKAATNESIKIAAEYSFHHMTDQLFCLLIFIL